MCLWKSEPGLDLAEVPGVDDVFATQPPLAGESDSVGEELQLLGGVGIRVDGGENVTITGAVPPTPIHVESPRIAVELNHGAGFGRTIDDFFDVEGVGIAAKKKAAGEVPEHGDMFVFHGADDALGHLGFGEGEDVVDGSDAVVELGEDVIVKVERAIFEDIDLGAGDDLEFFESFVEFSNGRDLFQEAIFAEAVRLEGGFRMIGDAKILQAVVDGGGGHFFERVAPVGGYGVVVEGAAEVIEFDESGKLAGGCGFDFPPVFAEFGRHPVQSKGPVNVFFIEHFRDLAISGEIVFIEGEALFEGEGAEGDVVFLAAGEVLQGKGEVLVGNGAEVALQSVLQPY